MGIQVNMLPFYLHFAATGVNSLPVGEITNQCHRDFVSPDITSKKHFISDFVHS